MLEKLKNLHYDKSQPAFLQRLRAEFGAGDGKNNVQAARPGKSRLKTSYGEEDEPVIVDERGEGVSREEWERMQKADGKDEVKENGGGKGEDEDEDKDEGNEHMDRVGSERSEDVGVEPSQRLKAKMVEFGVGKKRKMGRLVGDDAGAEYSGEARTELAKVKSKERTKHEDESQPKPSTGAKPEVKKQKAKKIKLSFDEVGD